MYKFWSMVLFFTMVLPLYAEEQIRITKVRDPEIDLIDPESWMILKTVPREEIPLPLRVQKRENGTFLVMIDGKKVAIDVGAVNTDKKPNIKNLRDCNNSIKTNYVAAHRGLGKGCLE